VAVDIRTGNITVTRDTDKRPTGGERRLRNAARDNRGIHVEVHVKAGLGSGIEEPACEELLIGFDASSSISGTIRTPRSAAQDIGLRIEFWG
jgi:hypothetical protein